MYHSADINAVGMRLEWLTIDLGASYSVTSIVYYNRATYAHFTAGSLLELMDEHNSTVTTRLLDGSFIQTFNFTAVPTTTTTTTKTTTSTTSTTKALRTNGPLPTRSPATPATCSSIRGRPDGCTCTASEYYLCSSLACLSGQCSCTEPKANKCECLANRQCASNLCNAYTGECEPCDSDAACARHHAGTQCVDAGTTSARCA
jgi:hypothetical protein